MNKVNRVGPINFLTMKPSELRQRKGSFIIKVSLIDDNLSLIQKIMSQVIIVCCEHLWGQRVFSYNAISPLFDLCPDNEIPPNYWFSQDDDGLLVCTKIGIALG